MKQQKTAIIINYVLKYIVQSVHTLANWLFAPLV